MSDAGEVERLRADLEALRSELEEFAYAASHDLAEPLRTIDGFVGLLAQRYEGSLGDDADEFIGYITGATERMQAMIDGLLRYSRAGRQELALEPVPLGDVASLARRRLSEQIERRDASIEQDDLPAVRGDREKLGQALAALLENSIVFADDPPRIRISAAQRDGTAAVTIEDRGIGLDAAEVDKAFRVFGRLHGRDAYPGVGMGLAVARRIAERHGGGLALEPRPGGGAIATLTLPTEGPRGHE